MYGLLRRQLKKTGTFPPLYRVANEVEALGRLLASVLKNQGASSELKPETNDQQSALQIFAKGDTVASLFSWKMRHCAAIWY